MAECTGPTALFEEKTSAKYECCTITTCKLTKEGAMVGVIVRGGWLMVVLSNDDFVGAMIYTVLCGLLGKYGGFLCC